MSLDKEFNKIDILDITLFSESYNNYFASVRELRKDLAEKAKSIVDNCHIYMILELPRLSIDPKSIRIEKVNDGSIIHYDVVEYLGDKKNIKPASHGIIYDKFSLAKVNSDELPTHIDLIDNSDNIVNSFGIYTLILKDIKNIKAKVLYIGKSYGKNGEKIAIDRLLKHSTLQEIMENSENNIDKSVFFGTFYFTDFKGYVEGRGNGLSRKDLVDLLQLKCESINIGKKEWISIVEAILIDYFKPVFNTNLKNLSASKKNKTLKPLYKNEVTKVCLSLCSERRPYYSFGLYSEEVPISTIHHLTFDSINRKTMEGH